MQSTNSEHGSLYLAVCHVTFIYTVVAKSDVWPRKTDIFILNQTFDSDTDFCIVLLCLKSETYVHTQ